MSAVTQRVATEFASANSPATRSVATDDYVAFCSFLRGLCGLDLSQYKRAQMERRLRSHFAARGITDLTETFGPLRRDPAALETLLDRITINVSQLWRNPEQWELLATTILPELARTGAVRAWSAGCSYGAEAFTLAAVCRATVPDARVSIRGTDIDKRMVARARQGVFSVEDARTAPLAGLEAAFERVAEGWSARPALKSLVHFEVGDLLTVAPRPASFDLILCRNTVIYFSEPIRDALHARLAAALRPGGYLMVGSTERVTSPAEMGLSLRHPFVYEKA